MSGYIKTPTIFQMEAAECGAASLAMILAYHGRRVPTEKIRVDTGVSRDGSKAGNLIRAAAKYGLEGHGYKKSFTAMTQLTPPCILLLNYGHFVVFEGIKNGWARLNDPAMGRRRLRAKDLEAQYGGVALTFMPTQAFEKESTPRGAAVRALLQRVRRHRGAYALTFLVALISAAVCAGLAVGIQLFVDDFFAKQEPMLGYGGIILLLLLALEIVLLRLQSILRARLKRQVALPSARYFAGQLLRLPLSFYEQRYPGELVNRMEKNSAADNFVSGRLPDAVFGVTASLIYLAVMCFYSPILGAVAAVCFLLQLSVMIALSYASDAASARLSAADGRLAGKLYAGLRIIDTLKASGAERDYPQKLEQQQSEILSMEQQLARVRQTTDVIASAVRFILLSVLIAAGAWAVMNGRMNAGGLAAFILLFAAFFAPVETLAPMITRIGTIRAELAAAEDVLRYERDRIYDTAPAGQTGKLQGEIILRHIDFSYSSLEEPFIRNLSLKIEPGSMVAVVGATGSGKSTIAKLISGLYQPRRGDIRLDGVKLTDTPKDVINASIATVSQNTALFSGSIRDNITMWNSRIPDEDIVAAVKDTCLYDFILSKPEGFDTMVSENGSNLSGGQRQRIEIARALAVNPSIIIMDEATSALDPITEETVIRNIRRRGCTCVMIAHRLSAVRDCDTIIVMDSGGIAQRGTHAELIKNDGMYRRLVENR